MSRTYVLLVLRFVLQGCGMLLGCCLTCEELVILKWGLTILNITKGDCARTRKNFCANFVLWSSILIDPANSSQSDNLQVKSPILLKQTDWCYLIRKVHSINSTPHRRFLWAITVVCFILIEIILKWNKLLNTCP